MSITVMPPSSRRIGAKISENRLETVKGMAPRLSHAHLGMASAGVIRQQPDAPVDNINPCAIIIDGRGQGPGGNFSKYAQSESGILFKIALMANHKSSKQFTSVSFDTGLSA